MESIVFSDSILRKVESKSPDFLEAYFYPKGSDPTVSEKLSRSLLPQVVSHKLGKIMGKYVMEFEGKFITSKSIFSKWLLVHVMSHDLRDKDFPIMITLDEALAFLTNLYEKGEVISIIVLRAYLANKHLTPLKNEIPHEELRELLKYQLHMNELLSLTTKLAYLRKKESKVEKVNSMLRKLYQVSNDGELPFVVNNFLFGKANVTQGEDYICPLCSKSHNRKPQIILDDLDKDKVYYRCDYNSERLFLGLL